MEKETLIQNLKEKVGEDNRKIISDKTFDGVAESVLSLFSDDEKITDETWKLPVATLVQFAGQKRFDEKSFAEKFKTDYETQHAKEVEEKIRLATEKAIEDYKKEHPDKQEQHTDDLEKKVAEAVAKSIEALTGKEGALGKSIDTLNNFLSTQAEREKTDIRNRVRSELKKHLVNLKANNEACIDDALDDIEYGENPTFEALKQSAIDAYEKRYKRYYADGGKPFGGDSTGGGGSNSLVKDKLEKLKKEAEESQNYAEQISKGFM